MELENVVKQKKYEKSIKMFWRKVDKADSSGCWLWLVSTQHYGYGQCYWQGKRGCLAHRVAYEIVFGKIPKSMCVLHKCDNPPCVNPAHLFLGTRVDNTHDMVSKGRVNVRIGVLNPNVKVSIDDVHKVRELYKKGNSVVDISCQIGIPYGNTWSIVKRKSWVHLL